MPRANKDRRLPACVRDKLECLIVAGIETAAIARQLQIDRDVVRRYEKVYRKPRKDRIKEDSSPQ